MICNVRIIQFASSAMAACALLSRAPASAQGVKIGVLNDQSGVYADFGGKGSVEAAKMAIEDFGGNVLGEKIELINADHQNKPDLATAIARRWYDVEGVDMITDLTSSAARDGGREIDLILVIGADQLDLLAKHAAAKILNRHLRGFDRPPAAKIGVDSGLIVEDADLDALR